MTKITNEQINEIAESMPGGLEGFMKGWGWQQFAHKLLGLQEHKILDLQSKLAKVKKSRKKWRNRAIANLADNAASDTVDSLNKMSIGGDFVKVESGEEKQEQAAKTLTHNGKTYPVGVWIECGGGEDSPIPNGVKYKACFRDGEVSRENIQAPSLRWNHVGNANDITAFMIL